MCSIYEYRSVYCWSHLNVPQGHVTTEQETVEESTQAVSVFDENSLISFETKQSQRSNGRSPTALMQLPSLGLISFEKTKVRES